MDDSLHTDENQILHTEPSFCIYSDNDELGENEDLIKERLIKSEGKLERSVSIGENVDNEFSFGRSTMMIIKEEEEVKGDEENDRFKGESLSPPLSTEDGGNEANGIGSGNVRFRPSNSADSGDLGEYYNAMICENPSDPLVLRNYAQYLEAKRDFVGAEEYYYRATLADPKDGEVLSLYAKLVWQIHGDQGRASLYFERATEAAPEDSHVLAAHANFLWEIDENDDEEEDNMPNTQVSVDFEQVKRPSSPSLHLAMGLGINMVGFGCGDKDEISDVEEHDRRMVEENPCNPLVLRNYANFLHQSKGDLDRAEDYYSRAILADPYDGLTLSEYANLVWQLHRDKDRALSYFNQAVQATPEDSNVLASYAKFLWEMDDDEDDTYDQKMPFSQRAAAVTTNA
ncbi:hypothetical protein ACJIZ3_017102 [Penstemon smallii]|uniref:Uncharacterized protein n=1 Tax=Penstemon smallii TaxID=265156 RepID=A0ABD3SV05_9LAMI